MYAADAASRKAEDESIPTYLKDVNYKSERIEGYKYPHDYGGWVEQQYLPDPIKDRVYYQYGPNKTEQASKAYWDKIKHPAPQED